MSIFHRYKSEIHGNYRKAYLRSGLLTGGLLALYVLARQLMGRGVEAPTSLVTDLVLLVLVVLLTAWYRHGLPESKISLKEAMLFGIGTSAVAAVVYALALLLMGKEPWWMLAALLDTLLLGSFGAFLASIFFRNEKSEIKHHKK